MPIHNETALTCGAMAAAQYWRNIGAILIVAAAAAGGGGGTVAADRLRRCCPPLKLQGR